MFVFLSTSGYIRILFSHISISFPIIFISISTNVETSMLQIIKNHSTIETLNFHECNHDLWRFSSIMKIMIFYAYFIAISFYWKEKIVNRSLQSYENSQFWFQIARISINATNIKQIILEVLNYIYIYIRLFIKSLSNCTMSSSP